jgi:hypothetical protein
MDHNAAGHDRALAAVTHTRARTRAHTRSGCSNHTRTCAVSFTVRAELSAAAYAAQAPFAKPNASNIARAKCANSVSVRQNMDIAVKIGFRKPSCDVFERLRSVASLQ